MANKTDQYKKRILKELSFGRILSVSDLSTRIERSLPLTLRILTELVEEGIVEEKGYAPSTGGRRPLMYSLVANKMYVVSVAMDQLITRIGMMDLQNGKVINTSKFPLDLKSNPNALAELSREIRKYIDTSGINKEKFVGVGIGMPGFVDAIRGINYSFLDNKGQSITTYIEQIVELPIHIDNDSSLIALAESKLGVAKGHNISMVINISWGVGLGMIVNGELFRGHDGFAGEFSHMPMFNNNKLCSCGKSGCLETESSLLVVVEKAKEGLRNGKVSTIKTLSDDIEEACNEIIGAALKGDAFCVEILSEIAFNIGRGIAVLIHIMNPELMVLSGRGTKAGHLWLAPIQQALNRYCIPRLAAHTSLAVSTFHSEAELIGAAALVLESLEEEPMESLTTDNLE